MHSTKSVTIILSSGREYFYSVEQPDVNNILLFDNNITINFTEKGPIIWLLNNLAGFSHDKEINEIHRKVNDQEDQEDQENQEDTETLQVVTEKQEQE